VAHPKHEAVRQRFGFCCGYCGVTEVDVGGELTVDHFHPVSAGWDDGDDNLVYACMRCNLYKSDYTPNEADRIHERRLLHPLLEDTSQHLQEDRESGRLQALTETGRFHITLLRLNRPELVEHRLRSYLAALTERKLQNLTDENALLRTVLLIQRAFLPGRKEE